MPQKKIEIKNKIDVLVSILFFFHNQKIIFTLQK